MLLMVCISCVCDVLVLFGLLLVGRFVLVEISIWLWCFLSVVLSICLDVLLEYMLVVLNRLMLVLR